MKIICLEEHFATPAIIAAWQALDPATRDLAIDKSTHNDKEKRLRDLAYLRLAAMDEAGIDVAVLSHTTPGVQVLPPEKAVPLAREANDMLAEIIRRRPDRFQGLATLPMPAPEEAARELERAVTQLGLDGAMLFGRTGDRNLDHPDFRPVLRAASELRAPLYIHPQTPQAGVRAAYYDGLGDEIGTSLATSGLGWHFESGVQAIRLILSGVFETLTDLRLILGHWGEAVLFYLDRINLNGSGASAAPRIGVFPHQFLGHIERSFQRALFALGHGGGRRGSNHVRDRLSVSVGRATRQPTFPHGFGVERRRPQEGRIGKLGSASR